MLFYSVILFSCLSYPSNNLGSLIIRKDLLLSGFTNRSNWDSCYRQKDTIRIKTGIYLINVRGLLLSDAFELAVQEVGYYKKGVVSERSEVILDWLICAFLLDRKANLKIFTETEMDEFGKLKSWEVKLKDFSFEGKFKGFFPGKNSKKIVNFKLKAAGIFSRRRNSINGKPVTDCEIKLFFEKKINDQLEYTYNLIPKKIYRIPVFGKVSWENCWSK